MSEDFRVLIADDESSLRQLLRELLEEMEIEDIKEAADGRTTLELLKGEKFDLLFLDIKMPQKDGMSILKEMGGVKNRPRTIIITAYGDFETALEAMRLGAFDYLAKPFDIAEVRFRVGKVLELKRLEEQVRTLKGQLDKNSFREQIVGHSEKMLEVIKAVGRIAASPVTVLLMGESGTGKELIARAIHRSSDREGGPFIPVNCAAIPESLLESELFGYEKGAFTGALQRTPGKFELAQGGTIFLDEIGDMSLALQAKLLRVLQDHTFMRVGGKEEVKVDVRVIAATNQDIEKLVKEGKFREDLYYRLNVCQILLPPLRERKEDIDDLVQYFILKYSKEYKKEVKGVTPTALERLISYPWPGNVRELENALARAIAQTAGSILTEEDFALNNKEEEKSSQTEFVSLNEAVRKLEKNLIRQALNLSGGNQTQAAKMLGITRQTLASKIKEYGISFPA